MRELEVPCRAYGSEAEISANVRSALARGLPELHPALCSHDGTLVICCSGPSLPDHLEDIREQRDRGRPILAVNGAHDLLCDSGIQPNLFLTVDPRDTIIRNTQRKAADTIYLLASRCNPSLFDHLKDCKVMLWHSWSPGEESLIKGHMGIGGGTTSGTRAIYVGYIMGFRRFVVYGMDSCLAADKLTKRFSGELANPETVMDIRVGETGKVFYANPPMAQQAQEVQTIMATLPDITIDFKGPGLIAAIWSERRKLGLAA